MNRLGHIRYGEEQIDINKDNGAIIKNMQDKLDESFSRSTIEPKPIQQEYDELITLYGELTFKINVMTEEIKQYENQLIETHRNLTQLIKDNPKEIL